MISIKLTIDERRIKQDGTYPIIFRLSSLGVSRDLSTGFSCKQSDWNSRACTLKATHPSFELVASRIKELHIEYLAKIIEFEKTNPDNKNVQRIKEYLISTNERTSLTVSTFWEQEIKLMQKANRNGGARIYQLSLNALQKVRNLNAAFESIDYTFLKALEAELISNGLNLNSVAVHFRTLRAIYNRAINSKLVSQETYPFKAFKIRRQPTKPRVLTLIELKSYFALGLNEKAWLYENWLIGN